MFQVTKCRIYPKEDQKVLIAKHFGCVRWIYNWALQKKKSAWETEKKALSGGDLSAELPKLKAAEETAWLKEVNAQSLQASINHLEMAYTRFFRLKKDFPKFKSKYGHKSYKVMQCSEVQQNSIKIPKVGKIKTIFSRLITGKLKSITISQTSTGKYFASILTETDEQLPEKLPITESRTIGIDLGLTHFATLSTGEKIDNPRPLIKRLKSLRRCSRKLSKKKLGSKNRNKQRIKVAKVHEKISNTRKDFLHKLTHRLVHDNQVDSFAIEDLAVSNMVQNRRLARSIADAGWGMFRTYLKYKADRVGKNIIVIGRFEPSSRIDHKSGSYIPDLQLSDRVIFHADGTTTCRDVNAAINIKRFALHPQNLIPGDTREFALEETCNSGSMNQESL